MTVCKHEPNMETLEWHKRGRKTTCLLCGKVLYLEHRVSVNPSYTPKEHMSKRDRLAKRNAEKLGAVYEKVDMPEAPKPMCVMARKTRKGLNARRA